MSDNTVLCAASICAAAALALALKWRRNRSRPPYPPGPRGYPFIGGILDVPRNVPIWKGFISIARKFNTDVLYIKLFSTDFVVLNSSETICDLLEGRSIIYSDRPTTPMLDLVDAYSWSIPVIGYGNKWRKRRRLFHEFFNPKAIANFEDHQRKYAYRFLSRLAQTPDDFPGHAKFVTGALIMEITYGLNIKTCEDEFLRAAERAIECSERIMIPGEFLVDTFPALKQVPEWFPGAGFKRFAKEARKVFDAAADGPLEYVKESLKSNGSNISVASSCFDRVAELQNQGFDESDIRAVTATTYLAGTDTTLTILKSFFLVMALHPHVVRKAQQELDRVLGKDRLPELSDQEDLPYISALLKELLRWACPLPFGVPKRVMEDDLYKGYLIPAGATILENIWAVCYNEKVFPAPQTYNPERFLKDGRLDDSIEDPGVKVFGSGRRSCPGRHFALRTLFLNIACTLAVFDISAPDGEELEGKYREGFVRHPLPFKCVIKPRSVASLKLARDAGAMVDR